MANTSLSGWEGSVEWDTPENPLALWQAIPRNWVRHSKQLKEGGALGGGAQESAWPSGRPQPALMGTTRGVSWNPGAPVMVALESDTWLGSLLTH